MGNYSSERFGAAVSGLKQRRWTSKIADIASPSDWLTASSLRLSPPADFGRIFKQSEAIGAWRGESRSEPRAVSTAERREMEADGIRLREPDHLWLTA